MGRAQETPRRAQYGQKAHGREAPAAFIVRGTTWLHIA